ncbi:MAG: molybdenum cofactor guanylyltransferase [Geitlerinemataceae cyanobacterium]
MTTLNTIVLAGGQSKRMGRDKALILWDGIPMLQRVYRVAVECGVPVSVLTPWRDRYQNILPPDCQWIEESQPGEGPLVALAQGLAQLDSDWIWLLACDLPQLDVEILRGWIDRLKLLPESTLACVPQQTQGWEPLCGFYRREVRSNLETFLASGGRSFQQWLPQIEVEPTRVGKREARMLRNCNTPEDL